MKKILIVTNSDDPHADFITQRLIKRSLPFFRLDTDLFLTQFDFEWRLRGDFVEGKLVNRLSGHTLDFSEVLSVWYRRPVVPWCYLQKPEHRQFVLDEAQEFLLNLYACTHAFWVSSLNALEKARKKLDQLRVAATLGLTVPDTLVSNLKESVGSFFVGRSNGMVVKSLKIQTVGLEGGRLVSLRTKDVKEADLVKLGLYVSPSIFQAKIVAEFEVRVVCVGRKLFSFGARSRKGQITDIKDLELEDIEHFQVSLSTDTEQRIKRLLDYYGLAFSSMDFIVTPSGEEIFLEMNPNGQWLWLQFETGVNVADNFIDMLASGKMLY